jgi:hypothetical protein
VLLEGRVTLLEQRFADLERQLNALSGYVDYLGTCCGAIHVGAYNEDHTAEADGARLNFITANEFVPGTVQVWQAGILGQPGAGYDYVEDATCDAITCAAPPPAGVPFLIAYVVA